MSVYKHPTSLKVLAAIFNTVIYPLFMESTAILVCHNQGVAITTASIAVSANRFYNRGSFFQKPSLLSSCFLYWSCAISIYGLWFYITNGSYNYIHFSLKDLSVIGSS